MSFAVRYSSSARDDVKRLYGYLLERSTTIEDLATAEKALDAIVNAVEGLSRSPFIYPKNSSYPAPASAGGGVGSLSWPTIRWQM